MEGRRTNQRGDFREFNLTRLFQVFDKVATRIPSPCRAPQTDAVQRAVEVEEILRTAERSSSRGIERNDLRELQRLLAKPHFKVSFLVFFFFYFFCTLLSHYVNSTGEMIFAFERVGFSLNFFFFFLLEYLEIFN